MGIFRLFIIAAAPLWSTVSAFCLPPVVTRGHIRRIPSMSINLVTEADVIALVEKAEDLWGQVEKLRKEANELSIQAETLGQDAEASTADAMEALKGSISVANIAEANNAQNLSIDLGSLVERAAKATEEADQIEVLAEEALVASEKALEQHLIDFPEDDEIDTI